jgi:hypothetical protein
LGNLVFYRPKQREDIELFLSAGVHPDMPDSQEDRLTHWCALKGWREAAGAIVLCRPDMAARNDENETPLMVASNDNYGVRVGLDRIYKKKCRVYIGTGYLVYTGLLRQLGPSLRVDARSLNGVQSLICRYALGGSANGARSVSQLRCTES